MVTSTRKTTLIHILSVIDFKSRTIEFLIDEMDITSVGSLVAFTKSELENLQKESKGEIKTGTIKKVLMFRKWLKTYYDKNVKSKEGQT